MTIPLQSEDDQLFPVVDGTEKIPVKDSHVAAVTALSDADGGRTTEATTSAHKTEPKEEEDDQLPLMLLPPPNDPEFYAWVDLLERLHRLNRLLETKEEQAIALDYEFALVTAAANNSAGLETTTTSTSETSTGGVTAAEEISTRNATAHGQEILSRGVTAAGLETSTLQATAVQEISTQHVTAAQVPEASREMSTPVRYVTPPPCFNLEVAHFREVNARLTAEISRNSGVLQRLEAEGRDKRRLVTQLEFDVNIVEREHKRLEADLHTVRSLVLEGYKVLIT